MPSVSAFDQFLLLQDTRNKIVYDMAIAGKKLKKAISDLSARRSDLALAQKFMQKCVVTRDFLFYEAKVVLLSEWERAVRGIGTTEETIFDCQAEVDFLEKQVKSLNAEISDMTRQIKDIDKKMAQFGKLVNFNGNRQKTSGE